MFFTGVDCAGWALRQIAGSIKRRCPNKITLDGTWQEFCCSAIQYSLWSAGTALTCSTRSGEHVKMTRMLRCHLGFNTHSFVCFDVDQHLFEPCWKDWYIFSEVLLICFSSGASLRTSKTAACSVTYFSSFVMTLFLAQRWWWSLSLYILDMICGKPLVRVLSFEEPFSVYNKRSFGVEKTTHGSKESAAHCLTHDRACPRKPQVDRSWTRASVDGPPCVLFSQLLLSQSGNCVCFFA